MPRKVDHQERRTRIADALMRVAAREGLEAISLRHVAAEAGCTTGMVQHHFRTKDEMMAFAMEIVRERSEARINAAMAALGPDAGARAQLRTLIMALLPLDDASREAGRVALAFMAYAAVRPEATAFLREGTPTMIGYVASQLPHGTAERAAGLLSMMEGLGMYLLGDHLSPDLAVAALDTHLDLLWAPPVR
ncbi:TetR/AcrR family transcriptional regulator [Actinoplanes sp. G11-F43]|uniref:TetR/AcrR family transcriptional regulator n=1 Tax=Actinoplanes sp. G11-F43 TaxID=3424130 RepID=UPI003D33023D